MDLTDSFTWKDLPTRDADTGYLTATGWIPLTMKYGRNAAIVILCFHTVQTTIRIVTNHETLFITWYPFDWTVSPFYELVNISQVTFSKTDPHKSGGADNSLARPIYRCRGTESLVSVKEGSVHVPKCRSFLVTEVEKKMSRDARDFNKIEKGALVKYFSFSCKARRRRKFTPNMIEKLREYAPLYVTVTKLGGPV